MSLLDWINDGLMTIFFFVVGLEIKRELVRGELRDPRNTVLPAAAVRLLGDTARETISPLDRLETALHPWVAFGIMPVFAFANAGVRLNLPALTDPVAIAVASGLALGKPLGIVVFSAVAVKSGLAKLPDGVDWKVMTSAGLD